MNLRQADDVASRLFLYRGNGSVTLPSNTEIRELVGFIRAVLPGDRFDHFLLAAVEAQPFRFDAEFADLVYAQFGIATEIIDGNPILRHKVSREPEIPVQRKQQGPSPFEVLATIGYGLIFILSLWRLWQSEPYGPWAVMLLAISIMVAIAFARRKKRDERVLTLMRWMRRTMPLATPAFPGIVPAVAIERLGRRCSRFNGQP